MSSLVQFETPENVQIAYQPAGPGTRFCAWLLDVFFVTLAGIVLFILALFLSASLRVALRELDQKFGPFPEQGQGQGHNDIPLYFLAVAVLFWGLGSFVYFTLSELFGRGQTIGKRSCRIRVVKTDGFSLDAGSILLRNVLRLVDQLPPLWIVPVLSSRGQRFGDMAAGTIVVAEAQNELGGLRTKLLGRPAAECKFRFDGTMLSRATSVDIEAVERILERWPQLSADQRLELLARLTEPLARKIGAPAPDMVDRAEFLEDFLAASYRRESRRLG